MSTATTEPVRGGQPGRRLALVWVLALMVVAALVAWMQVLGPPPPPRPAAQLPSASAPPPVAPAAPAQPPASSGSAGAPAR